ncbi:MAG: AarF/ABC1/UbiB kinase family protein [Anaeromyxobacteraceae bacterium]
MEEGLGHPLAELFAWVEEEPLASASIAQVHRARTHAGEDVVVKVQHPRIQENIDSDLALLHYLAKVLEAVVEEVGVYTPSDVIAEFDRTVHEELDFSNEARNARAMRDASVGRDFLVIPKVLGDLTCPTVLTLERVEGRHLSDVANAPDGLDLEAIARNLIEAAFRQLFEDGLFHGDPHPGNILVLPGNRIALLDFGLVGRLSRQQQEALVTLIVAVALRDPESVARMLNRIGMPDTHGPIGEFKEEIRGLLDRYLGLKLDEIRSATLARDLLDLAVRHKIKVPKEYAVLGKAAMTIEGIVRRIYPKLDILEVGMPYAKELLLARFNPSDTSGLLMKSLLKFQGLAEDVPGQLSQILLDLESGKFRVHVQPEAIDRLGAHLRSVGITLFLGLLAASLAGAGIVAMALHAPGVVGPAAVAGAAILSGVATLHHLAPTKLPKISVRKFLGK